ncbi:energy-coupling factor transporter ATPase [Staphylococcus pasteuri]|uniref:energy-coupling factor transporter ATPase n=1 Tax=Staphylococcus pasteuri TaxID=45972 RepID=UPI000D381186|nr:energy-coupling factor transporter ATPase [Staphylococcus pasteuri]PTU83702.1 energy-coupling factor transporter ATPase [Staphylococcus pasteuri]PTU84700.1 energy-coupling factor transporter ATPase [Staphylococcus pasteuri]RIO36829.1 energy-coupling factor transporter ATPase [Staphylococcus pasteuri]RIO41167.1 energy-coupling factor transporter ATPase [Staphylococcus pasteuri]
MSFKMNKVSYTYQLGTPYEYTAIKNISVEFEKGHYYTIVGQTGSGKSTLIQHINALLKPTSGDINFNGIYINHKSKDKVLRPIRQNVGMVFQFPESQLFEDTVEKEIEFGPKNFNMNIQQVKEKAFDMLLDLGFSRNVMSLSPFQMSGGQMRKIALVSILAMDPDIIVVDEPTAGLDPKSRHQVMSLLKKLQNEQNKIIILVTHDMNDVARYADEVIVMQKGEIKVKTSPRKLFSEPDNLKKWNITMPDVVRLQQDFETKYQTKLSSTALTEEEFVDLYREWQNEK